MRHARHAQDAQDAPGERQATLRPLPASLTAMTHQEFIPGGGVGEGV